MSAIFTPGFHEDIKADDYHALPWVSNSMRRSFREDGPRKFKYKQDNGISFEGTKATEMGSAFHTLVLEPELFGEGVSHWTKPEDVSYYSSSGAWNSVKKCKDFIAEKSAENSLPFFSGDDLKCLRGARNAMFDHPITREILEGAGAAELSMMAEHPTLGLKCKGRTDWQVQDENGKVIVLDLKSNWDLASMAFTIRDKEYDAQQAHYEAMMRWLGVESVVFVFAAIELMEPPHEIRVIQIESSDIIRASEMVETDLIRIHECMESGEWPSRWAESEVITVPKRWSA